MFEDKLTTAWDLSVNTADVRMVNVAEIYSLHETGTQVGTDATSMTETNYFEMERIRVGETDAGKIKLTVFTDVNDPTGTYITQTISAYTGAGSIAISAFKTGFQDLTLEIED